MKVTSLLVPIPLLYCFYAEEYGNLKTRLVHLYVDSGVLGLPKAYGLVFLSNIVIAGLAIVALSFKVSAARKRFKEKALKEGEKDAEARFSYPNLYVEGNTENAKLFNCAQRGHQQAFETYTQFVTFSLVSGLSFPVSTALCGLVWCISRFYWASGYAKGEPAKRYEHMLGAGIWFTLICLLIGATGTVAKMLF